ncbi:DNA-dependent ATPase [Ceratobasidium theobromae]|uniref:DNA-dependent ATPase n=1 Tax=Ceratobasidium theobromae TaxID=1582974 RepID=A0A5N5QEM5_9AGAM|nr:DNA-dependent ATPase [Ceratobasidium theobromae]
MSARGGRGGRRANNVRGPTSALTEFLREHGITAQPTNAYARRIRTDNNANPVESTNVAGLSTVTTSPTTNAEEEAAAPRPAKRKRNKEDDSDLDSDNLDATDDETPKVTPKPKGKGKGKGKNGAKELEKAKAKAKAEHEAKRRKKDDGEVSSEDEYKAPSKGVPPAPSALPPIGGFETCVICGKSFTVTRYTMAADPPPGFLCHACAKASGADPFKKTSAPRRRKPTAEKRKIVNYEQKDVFKSLATVCIEIIAKHIDQLEALGDIGIVSMDKVAKILAKQRSLTESTSKLFYNVENPSLTLYDVSLLEPRAFHTLVALNPNLQRLRLDYCRGVDCNTLIKFATDLLHLTHLELYGAFLARAPAFIQFFNEIGSRLQSFLLSHSPRLNFDCCEALVKNCADNLTELRLSNVGKLDDSWLPLLHRCTNLKYLELSYPGGEGSLTDKPTIELLQVIGEGLEYLDLSGHPLLSDIVLREGVLPNTPYLKTFKMSDTPLLTNDGVRDFFTELDEDTGIQCMEMRQNPLLSSESLRAFLDRPTACIIQELSINGWKDTDEETCQLIATSCPELKKLDIGFVRSVDDHMIKALLDGCSKIEEISCFGCNRVTEACPRKVGVNIYGVEAQSKR